MLHEAENPALNLDAMIMSQGDDSPRLRSSAGATTSYDSPARFAQADTPSTAGSVDASSTKTMWRGRPSVIRSDSRQLIASSAWLKLGITTAQRDVSSSACAGDWLVAEATALFRPHVPAVPIAAVAGTR